MIVSVHTNSKTGDIDRIVEECSCGNAWETTGDQAAVIYQDQGSLALIHCGPKCPLYTPYKTRLERAHGL